MVDILKISILESKKKLSAKNYGKTQGWSEEVTQTGNFVEKITVKKLNNCIALMPIFQEWFLNI